MQLPPIIIKQVAVILLHMKETIFLASQYLKSWKNRNRYKSRRYTTKSKTR